MTRLAVLAGLAVACIALWAAASPVAATEGPQLAFVKWGPNPKSLVLLSTAGDGSGARRLAGGTAPAADHSPIPFEGPAWSPDGSRIAYAGYVTSKTRAIFLANADGSDPHALPNTDGASEPVFAPDGVTLAFSRSHLRQPRFDPRHPLSFLHGGYESTTTWTLNIETGAATQLTPWRNGLDNSPSSFSPDGSLLAISRSDRHGRNAVALQLAGGNTSVIARNAEDAVFSPDGTRVAFVSYRDRNHGEGFDGPVSASELYVKDLAGGGLRRLTRTTAQQETAPSWDPSGNVIAYTQTTAPRGELLGLGVSNVVMEVNADGTCPRRVFGQPTRSRYSRRFVGLYGPVWQPGSGRDAAPISC